jgi:shikimate dehydrogenase
MEKGVCFDRGDNVMSSYPCLCCSFATKPSKVGVQYHNACYRALGLDYTYVAFGVSDLPSAVQSLRTLDIRGCGVTMPFKEMVLPYLDRLDPVAARIKSVNTIVNDDGQLTGYNVDWYGARQALQEVIRLDGKTAVVVGAGGASRAVIYALVSSGAKVDLYNRSVDRAQALANEFGLLPAHPLDELPRVGHYDILVNATSVGYKAPEESIVPETILRPDAVLLDIVAEPLETLLMRQARARGMIIVPGYRMRLLQAAEQFRLYTGVDAPLAVMERALIEATGT